ncbi:MAG: pilin [Candidatus Saccharimonadales bacterium]
MRILLTLFSALVLSATALFATVPAIAASDASKQAACQAIGGTYANGVCNDGSTGSAQPEDLVAKIINIFSWVVGAIAVIMLIFAGFKYVTSGGDAGKITSAKNTIIYALIGLVVVALSQTLVIFVLKKTNCATNPTSSQCK